MQCPRPIFPSIIQVRTLFGRDLPDGRRTGPVSGRGKVVPCELGDFNKRINCLLICVVSESCGFFVPRTFFYSICDQTKSDDFSRCQFFWSPGLSNSVRFHGARMRVTKRGNIHDTFARIATKSYEQVIESSFGNFFSQHSGAVNSFCFRGFWTASRRF